jgi:hypothetical protein
MGAERRPRSDRRRRDTAVSASIRFCRPETRLCVSSRKREALSGTHSSPCTSREVGPGSPLRSGRDDVEGGHPCVALMLRDRREEAIVSKDEGVCSDPSRLLSMHIATLTTTATHLSHPLSRTSFESKPHLQHHSTTAKCVATRSQRVHEMQHCDSGLHRISRPLSRTRNSLRGRRIRASRRASQR